MVLPRPRVLPTALLTTALLGSHLVLASAAQAVPEAAGPQNRAAACPAPDRMPNLGHNPTFTDNNVSVYTGGAYTVTGGAAEAEGLLVVGGRCEVR